MGGKKAMTIPAGKSITNQQDDISARRNAHLLGAIDRYDAPEW
jgi:hypothetical protein